MKIAIIGATGYVGSIIEDGLKTIESKTLVDCFTHTQITNQPSTLVAEYNVIIYCAGWIGKERFVDVSVNETNTIKEAIRANIVNPYEIAMKMNSNQLFLYMSTSYLAKEYSSYDEPALDTVNKLDNDALSLMHAELENKILSESGIEDMTTLIMDLMTKNKNLDTSSIDIYGETMKWREAVLNSKKITTKRIGLRLGSLFGKLNDKSMRRLAPRRNYVSQMVADALLNGYIRLQHEASVRPYLWTSDLIHVVNKIILQELANKTLSNKSELLTDKNTNLYRDTEKKQEKQENEFEQKKAKVEAKVEAEREEGKELENKNKIYNVASFNATYSRLAHELASKIHVPIQCCNSFFSNSYCPCSNSNSLTCVPNCSCCIPAKYHGGFAITAGKASKIHSDYDINFRGSPSVIIEDLISNVPKLIKYQEELSILIPSSTSTPTSTPNSNSNSNSNSKSELLNQSNKENPQTCKICSNSNMQLLINLGKQPPANEILDTEEDVQNQGKYDLQVYRCANCYHSQLKDVTKEVTPQRLFENYCYASSISGTASKYFKSFAEKCILDISSNHSHNNQTEKDKNAEPKIVLELASNDGGQLDHFKLHGWETYGVDPAQNLCSFAASKGHNIHNAFWTSQEADLFRDKYFFVSRTNKKENHRDDGDQEQEQEQEQVQDKKGEGEGEGGKINEKNIHHIDVIIAQNVLAHVPQPLDFLEACKKVMTPGRTLLYIQTSQADMFKRGEFDTVYHEHMSFFSGNSLAHAARRLGFEVLSIDKTPIHGTSLLAKLILPQSYALHSVSYAAQTESGKCEGVCLASKNTTVVSHDEDKDIQKKKQNEKQEEKQEKKQEKKQEEKQDEIQQESKKKKEPPAVVEMLRAEKEMFDDVLFWRKYQIRVESVVRWLCTQFYYLKKQQYTIVGYGAAAKGITLLNFLAKNITNSIGGKDRNHNAKKDEKDEKDKKDEKEDGEKKEKKDTNENSIKECKLCKDPRYIFPEYIVDDSLLKQGHLIPGLGINIVSQEALKDDIRPGHNLCVFVMAWNLLDEISNNICQYYREKHIYNVKILICVPFPEAVIYGIDLASGKMNILHKHHLNSFMDFSQSDESKQKEDKQDKQDNGGQKDNEQKNKKQNKKEGEAQPETEEGKKIHEPIKLHYARRKEDTCKLFLLSHMHNEEVLLPHWIRHHAPLADRALIIDYTSTDSSRKIFEREAPSSWKFVQSRNPSFRCELVDEEVRDYECEEDDDVWKITLNATEYIIHADLRQALSSLQQKDNFDPISFHAQSLYMGGGNDVKWEANFLVPHQLCQNQSALSTSALVSATDIGTYKTEKADNPKTHELHSVRHLLEQRKNYANLSSLSSLRCGYGRYIHRYTNKCGPLYGVGRHSIGIASLPLPGGYICKYLHTPWPELRARKITSNSQIPADYAARGLGYQCIEAHDQEAAHVALVAINNTVDPLNNQAVSSAWLNSYPNIPLIY